jgi:hypothetical protein
VLRKHSFDATPFDVAFTFMGESAHVVGLSSSTTVEGSKELHSSIELRAFVLCSLFSC